MISISDAFRGKKAFIAFITGGDPDIETTERLIYELERSGASLVEIGIPFSDPIAEGPVIQGADIRALASETTTDKLLDMVKRIRDQVSIPLVFMTYINPIYTYGAARFMARCSECGIQGVIVPDMPFEEREELLGDCKREGVTLISMVAPTSGDRAEKIAKEAEGFLYCVSSLGVTGVRTDIGTGISSLIARVREVSDIPCAIGFGVSTPQQAKAMSEIADGVIVGSAIVRIVEQYGRDCAQKVGEYVREMVAAIKAD